MINFLSSWIQGIIVAVILATIIEMILPKGGIEKYVKVVIGIYILFIIISPIIEKFSSGIEINDLLNISKYEEKLAKSDNNISRQLESNNNRTIKDIYIENLENDIKHKLEQRNYEVKSLKISIKNDSDYTISNIEIQATNKKKEIKEVNISVGLEYTKQEELTEEEKNELKKYLSETYSINKDIILIS
mgnify:CR=1 FL=1